MKRVWEWKEEYGGIILNQLHNNGNLVIQYRNQTFFADQMLVAFILGIDRLMVERLKEEGYLVKIEDISHAVGCHERCNTPIEPMIKLG
mgnify:CR=1 FL=1